MIVYKTTNTVNGKIYVGQDRYNNPSYLGSGQNLKRAIIKYGKDKFKKEILETCVSREQLNEREIYWISKLGACDRNVGYNIAPGGFGGDLFATHPKKEEWRLKNAMAMKGKPNPASKEKKDKISKAVKQSWIDNPYQGSYGRKWAPASIEKMRSSKIGKLPSKTQCPHCGRFLDPGNYAQHHGDKCKSKPNS